MLRLLLRIWTGYGGLLNGVEVADTKRCRRGGETRPTMTCQDGPRRAPSRVALQRRELNHERKYSTMVIGTLLRGGGAPF